MLNGYYTPPLEKVSVTSPFWKTRMDLIADRIIAYQWEALNGRVESEAGGSFCIYNLELAAGLRDGQYQEPLFHDSDLGKWIEAVSYTLMYSPNPEMEAKVDKTADLLEKLQLPNGYLDSYYIAAKPEERYKNFAWGHELYCCGHLLEGAVAYFRATGKRKLMNIMSRCVDHYIELLGTGENQIPAYPGHPEIELALIKLYRETGKERYLNFCRYLINQRGQSPNYLAGEKGFQPEAGERWMGLDYLIADKPLRQQKVATGHAVRAMYLYAGAADLAYEDKDEELLDTLREIWNNMINRRVYVTGGVGSHSYGERFSVDYDLPNDRVYAETCASIGLAFWAERMQALELNADYGDWLERAIYNGALSGISVEGDRYFYVNPLEVNPDIAGYRRDLRHVETHRVPWFGCACCPPNIIRMIASVGHFIYGADRDGIYVHQ
ncbi:MAG: glycoside hydrolase family 127 protein, partial [Clostridiales bacterium]|nr:glycoside hydrolase family 127 protein [Clostridiales bacterium]